MGEQTALYEFTGQAIPRFFGRGHIYTAALDAILRALRCDRASILLFGDRGVMTFVAWRGLSEAYRAAVEGHSPWTRESRDPQPIAITNIDEAELAPSLKATVKDEGIGALAFIPVVVQGELLGKFMAYFPTPHSFSGTDLHLALTIGRQLGFLLERLRAEKAKELLLSEMKHRIKNTLATIQAIAGQTLHHAKADELRVFSARLHALAEAHELLTTQHWHQARLRDVVERALKPFELGQRNRIIAEGTAVWVPANTSLHLTLCLHELATNAVKYGALSNGTGQVRVSWEAVRESERRRLRLTWQETGEPPGMRMLAANQVLLSICEFCMLCVRPALDARFGRLNAFGSVITNLSGSIHSDRRFAISPLRCAVKASSLTMVPNMPDSCAAAKITFSSSLFKTRSLVLRFAGDCIASQGLFS